ncbi:MAG: hemerythrin domain-containing protein [Bacteroidales bacterium]|nr:hemerythrin domain-containing protein [Bacteroidales bacterium]
MSKRTIFTSRMKMSDMIASNYDLILMLPRFGIPLGFGEKSVKEVCRERGVDENFFLTVCNIYSFDDYRPDDEEVAAIDHRLVVEHLQASHRYYIEDRLPHMQHHLDHVAESAGDHSAAVLKKYFSDYCREVRDHVRREERNLVSMLDSLSEGEPLSKIVTDHYVKSHDNIKDKLSDLTQIIYKYIPGERLNEEMMELVFDIMQLSRDLEKHAMIEELLLMPPEDYDLSDREQEVLVLVAQGLSSKEIATKLNIAVNTVNTHRKSITKKTGIKSVAGLAVYAMLKKK